MTDRTTSDLAALLTPPPSAGVQFAQGKVLTWEREELRNTIEWRGITLTDVPMVEGLNNLVLKPGDIVGLLGWAPQNSKGVGSWWILGKLSNPGEFIADLTFYLGQVRFRTPNNAYDQVYFGSDTDGEPLTLLFYGDASSSRALAIQNTDVIAIYDPSGNEIFSNDGATRNGLSRPYLYYHLAPTTSATINGTVFVPTTTSAAYVPLYEGRPHVWHPKVSYDIGISATGTTDWRIVVNGAVVFTGSPSASGDFEIPGWGDTVLPGHVVTFELEARNTGGGLTRMMVRRFNGRQT